MSVAITIQLSPSAIAFANKMQREPQEFPIAIKRGMDRSLAIVSGRIQERRLTGKGPFPVELHQLGERTGQLKLRTRSTPAVIETEGNNATVTGQIGSSVKYAAIHEFGGVTGRGHKSVMPERAPFRTGIKENAQYISDEISKECMTELKQ
jgi:hypothetical protein